jgi:hypothetical protein
MRKNVYGRPDEPPIPARPEQLKTAINGGSLDLAANPQPPVTRGSVIQEDIRPALDECVLGALQDQVLAALDIHLDYVWRGTCPWATTMVTIGGVDHAHLGSAPVIHGAGVDAGGGGYSSVCRAVLLTSRSGRRTSA